jgi:uncharacterized oxidoreductase
VRLRKGIACQPEVRDFVEAVFQQMIDKKVELTFGFSEVIAKATPEVVTATFNKMNQTKRTYRTIV